jgi:hypothetical protein
MIFNSMHWNQAEPDVQEFAHWHGWDQDDDYGREAAREGWATNQARIRNSLQ